MTEDGTIEVAGTPQRATHVLVAVGTARRTCPFPDQPWRNAMRSPTRFLAAMLVAVNAAEVAGVADVTSIGEPVVAIPDITVPPTEVPATTCNTDTTPATTELVTSCPLLSDAAKVVSDAAQELQTLLNVPAAAALVPAPTTPHSNELSQSESSSSHGHKANHGNLRSILSTDPKKAQRAFMLLTVRGKGVLLMAADKSKKGGVHYQLPGGRIDPVDYMKLNVTTDPEKLTEYDYVRVGKHAVQREIKEETGIHIKNPEDIQYLGRVSHKVAGGKKNGLVHGTELPQKLFFKVDIDFEDFVEDAVVLSTEHVGYILESDPKRISELVGKHSGGDPAAAVKWMTKYHIANE